MAQGDVITEFSDVATGVDLVVQPSAGEHWLVKDLFAANSGYFEYYDGTDAGNNLTTSVVDIDFASYRIANIANELNIVLNNTLYCRLRNSSGSNKKCGLTAIQIK